MKIVNFLRGTCNDIFGPRITKDIQRFINLNKKHWGDFRGSASNGYILLACKDSATHHVLASRAIKSIEEETGCLPIVILNEFSFFSGYRKDIYKSFDINNFLYYKYFSCNIFFVVKSLYLSLEFYFKRRSIDDLLKLEVDNIYIGDLIYDTILRNHIGLYTIDKFKFSYFKYIYSAFFSVFIYKKIFNKYKIKYVFLGLPIFIKWGIISRVADKSGAVVILARRNLMKNYKGLDIREGQYRPRENDVSLLKQSDRVYSDVDKYLANRFAGEICEVDAVKTYKGKICYDKDALCDMLNLDQNKPIVFIMAHAFSDGPHHSPTEKLLFRDFYVWLVETIKFVSQIKNVNWIVKPHPMSFKYKEEGAVEKLVDLFGKNNVHLAPENFSTKSIKDLAHAIVTVQGKAALEFGCLGIPSVVTSYAPYSGYGLAIEPKTKKEYFEALAGIGSVSRLNDEQIKIAKVLSAIMFIYSRTNDPFLPWEQNFLYSTDSNDETRWKQFCSLIEHYNRSEDEFYIRIKDLLNLNLYKKYLD